MHDPLHGRESIVEQMAAYLPMDRLHALVAGHELPARARGSVLFADISGFTPLTEALQRDFGPGRGGEELTRHLNDLYGELIREVHRYRGSVIGFSGDAITCWFNGDEGTCAAACGLGLQHRMARFQAIATPTQGSFSLAIKVAVTNGMARRFVVGDPHLQRVDVISGPLIDEMARAEKLAERGEVVVSEQVVLAAGDRAIVDAWRADTLPGRFAVLRALRDLPEPVAWPALDGAVLREDDLRPWLLPPVYDHVRSLQGDFLAELRQAVALFVRFQGLDFDLDDAVGEKLDRYVRWVEGVIDRYGGSLIQLTTGDKGSYLYAAFGAPLMHDDVIDRALSAALVLRFPPAELAFVRETQIGIGCGRMRTGAYGSIERRTYGVLGDETNVAARLMMSATRGQILVSARVAAGAAKVFRFSPMGSMTLKGKQESVPIFELVGQDERARHVSSARPIVGRRAERSFLQQAIDTLHRGERITVIVEGEPGIGKSQLVRDLLDYAGTKTGPIIRSVLVPADAIERTTPYHAWRDAFAMLFGVHNLDDTTVLRTRVLERLSPELLPLSPLLEPVLAVDFPETAMSAQIEGSVRAVQTPRYLARVFKTLVGDGRVQLVLEDVHWFDTSSWTLLEMVRRIMPTLMVALTSRPLNVLPDAYRRLLDEPSTCRLRVQPMQPEDSLAVACRSLGVEHLPENVMALVQRKAEGNPFFVEQLVQALCDAQFVRIENGQCHVLQALDALSFPDTIEALVTSRIDRLEPAPQLALKVASILGRAFKVSVLQDVFPIDDTRKRIPSFLDTLTHIDLTMRDEREAHPTYIFKHAVTMEVAYNMMLFEQRRALHERVADWYEMTFAEDLTPHYAVLAHHRWRAIDGHANPSSEQVRKAVQVLIRAGKQALENGATPEAIEHLQHASEYLEKLPPSRERSFTELDLRSSLGAAYAVNRGPMHEDTRREFATARQLCLDLHDPSRLFESVFGLWYAHVTAAEPTGALELSRQLLDIASLSGNPAMQLLAHQARGATSVCDGHPAVALEHLNRAFAIADQVGAFTDALARARNPRVMTYCYAAWASWLHGFPDRAIEIALAGIELAKQVQHPLTLTQCLGFAAMIHRYRRESVPAEDLIDKALALATEHGIPYWVEVALAVRGWIALDRGDFDAAIAEFEAAKMRLREAGVLPLSAANAFGDLIDAYTRAGRLDEAMTTLHEAHAILGPRLYGFGVPELHRLEGEIWHRRGDDERAEACLLRAIDVAHDQSSMSLALRAAIGLCRMRKTRGDAQVQPLLDIFRKFTEGFESKDLVEAKILLQEFDETITFSTTNQTKIRTDMKRRNNEPLEG